MKKFYEWRHWFVQVNRFGIWHGYENSLYSETFKSESEAIHWLNKKKHLKGE